MKKIFLAFLIGIFLIGAPAARAIGLSVSPRELKVSVGAGETVSRRLKVANLSNEVALFEVYPDDLEKLIEAAPASFFLESGQSREVAIRISPREAGVFKTAVSVAASPAADSSFSAGSGVKIPVEITVSGKPVGLVSAAGFSSVSISVAVAALAVLIFLFKRKIFHYVFPKIKN